MIIMLLYGLITIERCQRKQKGQQGRRKYLEHGVGLKLNCDKKISWSTEKGNR